jgi:penicillin-binding protein 1A
MMVLLRAVTAHGTGAEAAQLNHPVGGKTGTTSDYTDAWFLGFSPSITCGVWVGFDSRESLGEKETGARAALPIWMTVMRTAIVGKDNEQFLADQSEKASLDQKGSQTAAAKPVLKPDPKQGSGQKPDLKPVQKPVSKPDHTTAPEVKIQKTSQSAPAPAGKAASALPAKPASIPTEKATVKPLGNAPSKAGAYTVPRADPQR